MSKDTKVPESLIMPLYNLSSKMHGLGHLLENDASDMSADCDDDNEVRKGIGLLLKDLAKEVYEYGRTIDEWTLTQKGNDND